jgi:HKD family nuclease
VKVTPVTKAANVRTQLLKLIEKCQSFQWVTAWATKSDVLDAALASNKMAAMVIGTHQYFTAPEVLEQCMDFRKVKVMHPKGPMFHPKLYAFDLGDRLEVFVGSSNLTMGGLANNIECGVFLNDEASSPSLQRFTAHITDLWKNAKKLDDEFLAAYQANHRRAKKSHKSLEDFVEIKKPKRSSSSANDIDPQAMDWPTFSERVQADEQHYFEDRLRVLSEARQLFAGTRSFAALAEDDRKALAGLLEPSSRDGVHWALFGQMSAQGSHSPRLQAHVRQFSRALDQIPLQGEVTREHYDAYRQAFMRIPGAKKTWEGLATRLLAMKRPDYFVCLNGANNEGLCHYFSSAPTTTNIANYWDRIIAPMMLTPWWQADMPEDELEQEIWMGRAAMLDAIYYKPKKR